MTLNVDNHKLMYHPKRVAEWKDSGDCFPVYVEIGPTNRCNHKCIFCALDWVKKGGHDIDTKTMLKTLKDMAAAGVKSVMYAGEGEPLLHKDINLFIKGAKENGIDVAMTTNGVRFDKKMAEECLPHLSWIRFSVDAGTKETYAIIHRTREEDFDKVIRNIADAAEVRDRLGLKTVIGVQFLLIPENIHEASGLARIVCDAGADNIQIKPYSHHPSSHNQISMQYSQHDSLEGELLALQSDKFKVSFRKQTMARLESERDYTECLGLPFFALIDAKGNVIPCNLFYDQEDFTYGNINKQSFKEIWLGEQRKRVRQKVISQGCENCRDGCRLDVINRYLHRIKHPEDHDNFI
jgi:radical SAM protein with 4Fe4S-binding SPASM domain